MPDILERGVGSPSGFSDLDAKFDALFRRAEERLTALVSDESFRSFGRWATRSATLDAQKIAAVLDDDAPNSVSVDSGRAEPVDFDDDANDSFDDEPSFEEFGSAVPVPQTVAYSLELGRARLSLDEAAALGPDSIVPLTLDSDDKPKNVRLVVDGRVRARGVLLVVDGKLAVRIEEIDNSL